MTTMLLPISEIKEFPRDGVDNFRVNKYAKMLKDGVRMDSIVVFRRAGEAQYELYHGRHRLFAHLAIGRTAIEVVEVPAPIRPELAQWPCEMKRLLIIAAIAMGTLPVAWPRRRGEPRASINNKKGAML